MAKIPPQSLFDGLSGRVGGLLFCSGAYGTIVKAVPTKSRQKATDKQQEARMRFRLASKFINRFGTILKKSLLYKQQEQTEGFLFKDFMTQAIQGTYPDLYVNFPAVKLSRGNLKLPENTSITVLPKRQVRLSWACKKPGRKAELVLALYSPLEENWCSYSTALVAASSQYAIPEDMGDVLECYVFVRYPEGTKLSDSRYLGSIILED